MKVVRSARLGVVGFIVMGQVLCTPARVRAQGGAVALALDDGTRVVPVAHFRDGVWQSAVSCDARDPRVARPPGPSITTRLVATGRQVQTPEVIERDSVEWTRLEPLILELFAGREAEQHLSREVAASAPVGIDRVYAASRGADRVYYFEASRRIPDSSAQADADTDPPGTLRVAVAGFLRGGDPPTSLGSRAELRWEQDDRVTPRSPADLTPLGMLSLEAAQVWVMQNGSPRGGLTLYEVTARRTRTLITVPLSC
jgi:hypothetical protein